MTASSHTLGRSARLRRLRRGYFGSPLSALMTVISGAVIAFIGWVLLDWGLVNATFGADGTQETCAANGGACWSVIAERWRVILFGIYPYEEQWRSALACAVVGVVILLSCLPRMWSFGRLALVWTPTANTRLTMNYARLWYNGAIHPGIGGNRNYAVDALGIRGQVDF